MLTRKTTQAAAPKTGFATVLSGVAGSTVDRRAFLKRSGLAAGGLAAASAVPLALVRRAESAGPATSELKTVKNICTHCSVGCTVSAVVQNGVWVRQEPSFDSPINLGAHCAKGAAIREHAHGE